MENNTIQITPTIIGVVVDENARDFLIYENELSYWGEIEPNLEDWVDVILQNGKYKIHGTSTLPELEFDFEVAESWVESKWFIRIRFYKDYIKSKNNAITKEDSFQTRIQKAIYDAGLLLINPIDIKGQTFSNEHQNKWQESESKVIRGKLLIIEKI